MYNIHDPDEWETVTESGRCAFHKDNPGVTFAGCTCWVQGGMRRRDPAEAARLKAERVRKAEDDILAAADRIRERRALPAA